MNKIDQRDQKRLAATVAIFDDLFSEIEAIREIAEAQIAEVIERMETARDEVYGVLDDSARAAEEYYDDRSEKWQEGERGTAYAEWRDRLRELADGAGEVIEAPELPEIERPAWIEEVANADFLEFEFDQ